MRARATNNDRGPHAWAHPRFAAPHVVSGARALPDGMRNPCAVRTTHIFCSGLKTAPP
jgi:hypothetical protein